MRLGGVDIIKVDVRVVAATNVDLRRAVEEGRFREDLFYRLNVIAIQLPPLRQRKEDIPALVQHFVDKYARENSKAVETVTPEVLQVLMDYDWPGNVRELENVIERGVVLATTPLIDRELVPEHVRTSARLLPHPAGLGAARGHQPARGDRELRAPHHRVDARRDRRRAEGRGPAAGPQADDAQRDDQAPQHPARARSSLARRPRRSRARKAIVTPSEETPPSSEGSLRGIFAVFPLSVLRCPFLVVRCPFLPSSPHLLDIRCTDW